MFLVVGEQIDWILSTLIIIRMVVVLTTATFLSLLTYKGNKKLLLLKHYWYFMSIYAVVEIIFLMTGKDYLEIFLSIILGFIGISLIKLILSYKKIKAKYIHYLTPFFSYVPVMMIGYFVGNNYIYLSGISLYGILQIYLGNSIFKSSYRNTLGKNILALSFSVYGFANISFYLKLFFPEYAIFVYTLAIVMTISIAFSSILIAYENELFLRERAEYLQYPLFEKVSDFFIRIKNDEIVYASKSTSIFFNKPINYIEDLKFFFSKDDYKNFENQLESIKNTDDMITFNIIIKNNNEESWFRVNAFNYGLEDKVTEILFKDIQEEISSALKIKMEKNELEKQTKIQAEMFSKISHELKTPITIVMGFAETIESITEDEQIKNMTDKIIEASSYQQKLVEDVLDFSRLKAKLFKINVEKINIPIFIYEIIEQFKIIAEKKNILLEKEFYDIPEFFHTDPLKLKRILINLLDNAVKFTNKGKVKLIVRKETDRHLLFIVEDEGSGIDRENLKVIFKKFVQVNKQRGTIKGTGLGLSITKELVELLRGKIRVESELNKGTKFIFTIEDLYQSKGEKSI